jgi:hypothetical protein
MKKYLLVFVAFALIFTAGSAFAGNNVPNEIGSVNVPGDSVFFNYYDIRTMAQGGPGLTDNYFTVVNWDYDEWINAHVRVRTGQCSVELLDFDVLLSPNDIFTFDLYQAPDGDTVFASCDEHTLTASGFAVDANGCFILDTGTFPGQLSLIQECGQCPDGTAITAQAALEATRWGYVEVIGESEIRADYAGNNSACATSPSASNGCCELDIEAGLHTAYDLWDSGDCLEFVGPDPNLFGRVYYAMLDGSGNIMRLAQQNGHSFFSTVYEPYIVHRPCYSDTNAGCGSGDGELENPVLNFGDSFAYEAAATSVSQGAIDLNYCFWSDTITTAGDVQNRNGAAATFGPTWADFHNRGHTNTTSEGLIDACDHFDKSIAFSHYFYVPDQGESRFIFTFPIQHFLNQTIEVTKEVRFDTEQNECVLPTQKFISPGLPGPSIARGEVTIIEADEGEACAFNEGWIGFELDTTADGPDSCGAPCDVVPPTGAGYTIDTTVFFTACTVGSVVNWGNAGVDVMSISPMQFFGFGPPPG